MATTYFKVAVPVANLRRKPIEALPLSAHDELQISQLLLNETLLAKEESRDWLYVEAVEQEKLSASGKAEGYPGWVRKKDVAIAENWGNFSSVVTAASAIVRSGPHRSSPIIYPVSLGTRLLPGEEKGGFSETVLPDNRTGWIMKKDVNHFEKERTNSLEQGRMLVAMARLFLGAPYYWGGRSMPLKWTLGPFMGVDCSGFVNLLFRAMNIDIPRDAHDQWTKSTPVPLDTLIPGDLIFLSRRNDKTVIDHVMLFIGSNRFIEAPETYDTVRIQTWEEKFGGGAEEIIAEGSMVESRAVYGGRIIE